MNVLGLDTSTNVSAVCVLRTDEVAFEHQPPAEALAAPPAHARELMPAVVACLGYSALDWGELDAIAVGIGPGSFTGLRIGVATARALAHAHGLEVRPVSSLRALAAGAEEELDGDPCLAVIDARRGEVFAALFADGRELWAPSVAAPEALAAQVAEAGVSALAVGDGSVRFRHVLEAEGVRVAPDGSPAHVVRGLSICRLADAAPPAPLEAVLPEYLRLPDAKPR